MKLSLNIDLAAIRQQAFIGLDTITSDLLFRRNGLNFIYAIKYETARAILANTTPVTEEFSKEAGYRNLDVPELCQLIIDKHNATNAENMRIEAARQLAKLEINLAKSEQEIHNSVHRFERAFNG